MTLVHGLRKAIPDVFVGEWGRSDGPGLGRSPELVASPASTDEVVALIRWAGDEGLGVMPLASGRHVQPVATEGRFVGVETSRLAGIEEYEPADLTLTAGAGTSLERVDQTLRANGQWAPFDPPDAESRSLGGFVSDAPHGPLWVGYGALKNHVLGATVVTGDGRVLRLGGRVVKNVAGYDLLRPVVGGRGRLGVITSVCLRAFPLPTHDRVLVLEAAALAELIPVALAVGTAPVLPVSTVVAGPLEGSGHSMLVVRLHGAESTVDADQASIEAHVGRAFAKHTAGDVEDLLGTLQDFGTTGPRCLELSSLPSRLVALVSEVTEVATGTMFVDSYAGRIRLAGPELTTDAVAAIRAATEESGGALRVVRWDSSDRPAGTPPREAEARLSGRLESIFDPGGIFWPARP